MLDRFVKSIAVPTMYSVSLKITWPPLLHLLIASRMYGASSVTPSLWLLTPQTLCRGSDLDGLFALENGDDSTKGAVLALVCFNEGTFLGSFAPVSGKL